MRVPVLSHFLHCLFGAWLCYSLAGPSRGVPGDALSHSSALDGEKKCSKRKAGATWFPCKSAGSEGRRQGRAIPSCPLQPTTPRAVWPRDRERTPRLVAQRLSSLSYPPWRMGSRNRRAGDVPSCQCPTGAVTPRVGGNPLPSRNHWVFQGRNLVRQLRHKRYK